jgi:alcohol-forming fatty acyl-CoA reductase
MDIQAFYSNKTILVTGTTGFVGKVVLEKILRTCPNFKRIYLMVRPKKSQSIIERMKEGIFNSQIFDRVFKEQPALKQNLFDRVQPIAGDLVMQGLGISKEDRLIIVNEVDLIINCAASVNFDDPLLDAIQINYFGCYRMLELAKECKSLLSFTHVSTAYVNSNRTGFIEEKIYDLPGVSDPEEEIAKIQKLSP